MMNQLSESQSPSPTRLSLSKWILVSTLVLVAAIGVPILFKGFHSSSLRHYYYNHLINSEMASSMSSEKVWKNAESLYEFSANDLDGNSVSMEKYKGNVVIVVNVATYCGLTRSNYAQLNEIYNKYKDQGLRVAGFPCNQFGKQEPGCSVDIKEFLEKNNVNWDVYEKIDVNGKDAHPLWKWLQHKKGGFITDGIKWNFTKFLIDRQGNPVSRYGPKEEPKTFVGDIETELAKQ